MIQLSDPEATFALGRKIGEMLFRGAVIALVGPLGAGKTHFTRGLAEGVKVHHPHAVNSPTFVLIQEYDGPLPIYHFDTYRLRDSQAFSDLGAAEYLYGEGVCVIEWADKVQDQLPVEHLRIEFAITGERTRQVQIIAVGERYHAIVSTLHTSP